MFDKMRFRQSDMEDPARQSGRDGNSHVAKATLCLMQAFHGRLVTRKRPDFNNLAGPQAQDSLILHILQG